MDYSKILNEFCDEMDFAMLASKTIYNYCLFAKGFLLYTKKPIEELQYADVREYFRHMKKNSSWKSEWTFTLALIILKRFFDFLVKNKYIDQNYIKDVKFPKVTDKKYKLIEDNEIDELDRVARSPTTPLRTRAIYFLIRDTGMRSAEVADILRKDVSLTERVILIRMSKGKVSRFNYFTEETANTLREYIIQTSLATDEHLFQNYYSEKHLKYRKNLKISRNTVSSSIAYIVDAAFPVKGEGPEKRGSHILRHYFITQWAKSGVNLLSLAKFVGWTSTSQLMRYTHYTKEDQENYYNEFIQKSLQRKKESEKIFKKKRSIKRKGIVEILK